MDTAVVGVGWTTIPILILDIGYTDGKQFPKHRGLPVLYPIDGQGPLKVYEHWQLQTNTQTAVNQP